MLQAHAGIIIMVKKQIQIYVCVDPVTCRSYVGQSKTSLAMPLKALASAGDSNASALAAMDTSHIDQLVECECAGLLSLDRPSTRVHT